MLLIAALEMTNAHGLKSHAMSSVAGAKSYQNHGFKVVEIRTIIALGSGVLSF